MIDEKTNIQDAKTKFILPQIAIDGLNADMVQYIHIPGMKVAESPSCHELPLLMAYKGVMENEWDRVFHVNILATVLPY